MPRNSKYDWDAYWPKMLELYQQQMSIPKIRDRVVNEAGGFTPQLRIVYKKFRDERYPTNQAERKKLLTDRNQLRWAGSISTLSTAAPKSQDSGRCAGNPNYVVPGSTHTCSRSVITAQLPTQNDVEQWSAKLCNRTLQNSPAPASETNVLQHSESLEHVQEDTNMHWESLVWPYQPGASAEAMVHPNNTWNFGSHLTGGYLDGALIDKHFHSTLKSTLQSGWETPSLPISKVQHFQCDQNGFMEVFHTSGPASVHSVNDIRVPGSHCVSSSVATQPTEPVQPSSNNLLSTVLGGRSVPWAKAKPRWNRSCTPEKRGSISTRDSGYGSGRNSPLPPFIENREIHPRSYHEFKGLHRTPCHILHEPLPSLEIFVPQSQNRFRDVAECENCHYSGIHNLSWSSRHVKFEVFVAELGLRGDVYDITARDAAGNSALHYAAAGGAGFEHLKSLIESGIDPYLMNTAGQLFLHCLTPYIRHPGFELPAENLVDLFIADLINLMNEFHPKAAFDWPDNQGHTPLDNLASRLSDGHIQAQVFHFVTATGYATQVSNQFKNLQKSRFADLHTNIPHNGIIVSPHLAGNDFENHQERQSKAWEIVKHATKDPTYIDLETGDNVLHALARVLPSTKELLHMIQDSVSKGACPNHHNNARDFPLLAFIEQRPFESVDKDETGATLSKYLDTLLWKDVRNRVPNRINVNAKNREGATALYYAAVRGRPDSVRSLIEAGANVNTRIGNDGKGISILAAAHNAKTKAVLEDDKVKIDRFDNMISYLEHENAKHDPTMQEERALAPSSVMTMPI